MSIETLKESVPLVRNVTNWHNARLVFSALISAHPELGRSASNVKELNYS